MRSELHTQTLRYGTLRKKAKQERLRNKAKDIIDEVLYGNTPEELLDNFLCNDKRIKKTVIDKYNTKDQKGEAGNDIAELIETILKTNIEREAECFIKNLEGETYEEKLSNFLLINKDTEIIGIYPRIIRDDIAKRVKTMLKTKIREEQIKEPIEEQKYKDIAEYIIENELNGTTYYEKLMNFYLTQKNSDYKESYTGEVWDKIASFIEIYLIRATEQENENTNPGL